MNRLKIAALAAACLAAAPASATVLNFTITGDANISFSLDSNPTPTGGYSANPAYPGFLMSNVATTIDGSTGSYFVDFENNNTFALFINLDLRGPDSFTASGPNLFSGPSSNPVIATGTFALTGVDAFAGKSYTLSIVDPSAPPPPPPPSAVPEPATWAMMLGGFGLAGTALRRRRKSVAYA